MNAIKLSAIHPAQTRPPAQPRLAEEMKDQTSVNLPTNLRFTTSFFLFGLLNNVLYVIIISAALDLVPASIPTGVILVADVAPSLLVKIGWPYFVAGSVRYPRRILSCSALSFLGMMVIVFSDSVLFRLIGISLASISSGLGEMTFLQLSTRYEESPGVSWFASGTGAAGILGAGLWWFLRSLGVSFGLGISSILPICLSITYFFLLPSFEEMKSLTVEGVHYNALPNQEEPEEDATNNHHQDDHLYSVDDPSHHLVANKSSLYQLSLTEKFNLSKPLLLSYMIPLFTVYFAEYTINTGIAPTLLYSLPKPETNWIFSKVFKSLKDYYPFWQLTYQTFVFFSRSSMAIFKFPALPKRLIIFPSLIQMMIFLTLLMESSSNVLVDLVSIKWIYFVIFLFISFEGICGGLAYISAYHWLGHDVEFLNSVEVEFRIACVGFSDTLGILSASIFSSWLEPRLCQIQVAHNKLFCTKVS